mmetsp:Transcript_37742/g.88262  ORF Transcript_37742/g.88262 Transcript_37742/m.88262 type:complete len:82 (-) Transcript_37742:122-367(-)
MGGGAPQEKRKPQCLGFGRSVLRSMGQFRCQLAGIAGAIGMALQNAASKSGDPQLAEVGGAHVLCDLSFGREGGSLAFALG